MQTTHDDAAYCQKCGGELQTLAEICSGICLRCLPRELDEWQMEDEGPCGKDESEVEDE